MGYSLSDERVGTRHDGAILALATPSGWLYDPETPLESSMWSSTTGELQAMAEWLKQCRIRTVAMQSTGRLLDRLIRSSGASRF